MGEPERERYRAQVGNALFLQLLVGMKGERTGVNALLMGLIALITIVLAPLATLVLMQMMFLPYHHLRITWWHRGIVVADLVLIVVMTYRCFFPRGFRKAPLVLGALGRKPRWVTAMAFWVVLAVVLAPLVDWLSFRQGRWAGEPRASSFEEWGQWMAGGPPQFPEVLPDYTATANGVVFGLFPDRLELLREPVVGDKTLEETSKEIASRGGDFVPTLNLDDRDLQAAMLFQADLRGVALRGAAMQGASLNFARLDGANLALANLRGADLSKAQLQGAELAGVQLQGARLGSARLQGADLGAAQLQGVDLTVAQLQGADLHYAQLQGANLNQAQLQGADLGAAQLQGADLGAAQLQGADLGAAQLQGADLSSAELADSDFDGAFVFQTTMAGANIAAASIRGILADQVKPDKNGATERLSQLDVEPWIADATQSASHMDKARIASQFAGLMPEFQKDPQDLSDLRWKRFEVSSSAPDANDAPHRRRLATLLGDLACGADSVPYVARSLVARPDIGKPGRLAALGGQLEGVRKRMKEGREKPEACKGVAGFTEEDWRRLDAIKPD
jgi:uncharacterized protein YjbI with pentapeptide repeats